MFKLLNIFIPLFLLQSFLYSQTIDLNALSKKNEKPLLIFLHRIGCSYCNSMEEFTLDDEDVTAFIKKNHTFVSINITLKETIKYKDFKGSGLEFAKKMGYNFYPTVLFLNNSLDLIYPSVGYKNEKDFLQVLHFVQEKEYENSSFSTYKKSHKIYE